MAELRRDGSSGIGRTGNVRAHGQQILPDIAKFGFYVKPVGFQNWFKNFLNVQQTIRKN